MATCTPERNAPEAGTGVTELSYAVQGVLVKQCLSEEMWNLLSIDARRYLLNISMNLDKYFGSCTIPPRAKTSKWTNGEKQAFVGHYKEWIKSGVDPSRHWGLFSIIIPSKTGKQCCLISTKAEIASQLRECPKIQQENEENLYQITLWLFRGICDILLSSQRVNEAARDTACEEIITEQLTGQHSLTHETLLDDKVVYVKYPGTGCATRSVLCYGSVILQFLARIDELVDLVSLQIIASGNKFLKMFLGLRYDLETEGPLIPIDGLVEMTNMDLSQQQDAHELFVVFTNCLREAFDEQYRERFDAMFLSTVVRQEGDTISEETFTNWDVHLGNRTGTLELSDLLDEAFSSCVFVRTSKILVIHVVRTSLSRDLQVIKSFTRVSCSPALDMTGRGGVVYGLMGIIYHIGRDGESGHYFAVLFDDETILCIDGSLCFFVSADDRELHERLNNAEEAMFIYGAGIHLRCWFRVSQLVGGGNVCSGMCTPNSCQTRTRPRIVEGRQNTDPQFRFLAKLAAMVVSRKQDKTFRHLSLEEKLYLAAFSGRGISCARLARDIGRSPSTVARFLEDPLGAEPQRRSSILSNDEILKIVLNETLSAQRMSCAKLAAKIYEEHHTLISKETIRKLRRKLGLRFLSPIPKARLTDINKDTRVAFATHMLTNGIHLLRRTPIVFSDESRFVMCDNGSKLWRIPGECLESDYVEREQHSVQVMVWGAISTGYKSPLLCFSETCTQDSYMELLAEHRIFEELDLTYGHKQYLFQQDNAPPHVARRTLEWLEDKVYLLTDWPPHSPDLSPVEMMWALAKARIDTSDVRTAADLFHKVKEVWKSIPMNMVDNMVSSFEARLRAVCTLRGDSLNGHWGYVHRIHVLVSTTPIEKIDEEVMKLDARRDSRQHNPPRPGVDIRSDDTTINQPSTLLAIRELEEEFENDASASSSDLSNDEEWDMPVMEVESSIEQGEDIATSGTQPGRLANILASTARFIARVFGL